MKILANKQIINEKIPSKAKIIIVIGHIKVGGYMQIGATVQYVYYPAFFVFLGKGICY